MVYMQVTFSCLKVCKYAERAIHILNKYFNKAYTVSGSGHGSIDFWIHGEGKASLVENDYSHRQAYLEVQADTRT